ncbi:MAG TPA: RNHCP domain-containing protein [Anaerolineales bacterium]|nr:RNHCP domain-containing protein [Anaerolineales bacterium]
MYPRTYNPSKDQHVGHWTRHTPEETFRCLQCDASVYTQPIISGVQNRNHCPYCLCSRHVDHVKSGDRMSACKAIMQPIGLTVKPGRNKYGDTSCGELMLIHRCIECGKLSLNRLAADDQPEKLLEIYDASFELDGSTRYLLTLSGIHILQYNDWMLVIRQLMGIETI